MKTLVSLCLIVAGVSVAHGGTSAGGADDLPARCKALASVDFSLTEDAPTQIMEAKWMASGPDAPPLCQVSGYVASGVGFLLRLPLQEWNGKFIELGCGGACGSTDHIRQCRIPVYRGYACIVTDTGHRSTAKDNLWAYNNLQAQIDYHYRATHVTALAGKAIAERYYGVAPRKSYFMGCSAGGREGMMEAQHFPWDFDGIVAGSPSLGVAEMTIFELWKHRALTDDAGKSLVNQADLELLHQAVVAKCDHNDGVKDGLISDPRTCGFDPSKLLCKANNSGRCLTAKQVDAVKKVYDGPVTSQGQHITRAHALLGSERAWLTGFWSASVLKGDLASQLQPNSEPSYKIENFNFDRDPKRLGLSDVLASPLNPDLRALKAAGGKLLFYAGWNDERTLPLVDYYETAERTLGGLTATKDFFRFFVMPGMEHCGGGEGAFAVDYLRYLEAWVEKDQAPDRLLSYHVRLEDISEQDPDYIDHVLRRVEFPLDPAMVDFSRPVYPYPVVARYLGHGDQSKAENFGPAKSVENTAR